MLPRHDVGKDIRSGLYYYLVGTSPPPPDKTGHVLRVRLGGSKHAGRYIESQLHRKRARIVSWSRSPFAPTHGFKRARIQRRRRLFMGPLPFQHSSLGGCVATEGGRRGPDRIHRAAAGERCPGPSPTITTLHTTTYLLALSMDTVVGGGNKPEPEPGRRQWWKQSTSWTQAGRETCARSGMQTPQLPNAFGFTTCTDL